MAKNLDIIIITQSISPIVYPLLESEHNIIGIIESSRISKSKALALTLFDRTMLALRREPHTLKGLSEAKHLPYACMTGKNDADLERWVQDLQPDLMVVHSIFQLLKKNFFSIPTYGTINLHPSLLPDYRGPNPWFWMYYNMDKTGGMTVHYIDEGEDTGDIIYQAAWPVQMGATFAETRAAAMENYGVPLLLDAINAISNGNAPRIPQTHGGPARRARNLSHQDLQQIMDWDVFDVARVWHILRGTSGIWDLIEQPKGLCSGQRWEIQGYDREDMDGYTLGKIYVEDQRRFVACKNGKVYLGVRFEYTRAANYVLDLFTRSSPPG